MNRPEIPEKTTEIAAFSEFSCYHATIERDENGTVYFISWAWHVPTLLCAVYADGTSWVHP